jgi:hypothetical protein
MIFYVFRKLFRINQAKTSRMSAIPLIIEKLTVIASKKYAIIIGKLKISTHPR